MVVEAHEPIDGGEGEAHGKEREACKGDLAIAERELGGPFCILFDGITTKPKRGQREEEEVKTGTNPEKLFVKIGRFLAEDDVVRGIDCHPSPQSRSHKDERDEQNTHHDQEAREIFHLAPDYYAPFGIHRMMDELPKEATHADGEEEEKCEEVGEGKLLLIADSSESHKGIGNDRQCNEAEKTTAYMLVVEGMAAGLGWFVSAHGFCDSNLARSVAGTSLMVAPPWDFWSARM